MRILMRVVFDVEQFRYQPAQFLKIGSICFKDLVIYIRQICFLVSKRIKLVEIFDSGPFFLTSSFNTTFGSKVKRKIIYRLDKYQV